MAGTLSTAAEQLAAADPTMAGLIAQIGPLSLDHRRDGRPDDVFTALARIIVGQQVSTAAARTIWGRVTESFSEVPEPAQIVARADELRAAGLSGRKVDYVVGIAAAILDGSFDPHALASMDDDAVIAELTALRGVGRWSAEMFLMFHLARPDVFSGGDLGLRNGIRIACELEETPSAEEAERMSERWRPHRTLAAVYLWQAVADGRAA